MGRLLCGSWYDKLKSMKTSTTITDSQIDKAIATCTDALAFVAYCEARQAGKSHITAMAAAMKIQTA